jgi:hypothetical protein
LLECYWDVFWVRLLVDTCAGVVACGVVDRIAREKKRKKTRIERAGLVIYAGALLGDHRSHRGR